MRALMEMRPGAGNRWPETIPDEFTLHCFLCGETYTRGRKPLVNDTANYQGDNLDECRYFCSKSCKGKYAARKRHGPKYHRFCAWCKKRFEASKKMRISGVGYERWMENDHSAWATCSNSCKMRITVRLERQRGDTSRQDRVIEHSVKGGIATQRKLSQHDVHSQIFDTKFASKWERMVAEHLHNQGYEVHPSPNPLKPDVGPGPYMPDMYLPGLDLYLDPKAKRWSTNRQMRKISELTQRGIKIWIVWDTNNRQQAINELLNNLEDPHTIPAYTEIPVP